MLPWPGDMKIKTELQTPSCRGVMIFRNNNVTLAR